MTSTTLGTLTPLDLLIDPNLFGGLPAFKDLSTWGRWLTFLRACYGLPLDAEEVEVFRHHTGRSSYRPPPGGWPEIAGLVGRQAGKDRIASVIGVGTAIMATQEPDRSDTYALLIGQDHRAAIRTMINYANALLQCSPIVASSVENQTADTIRLENGISIAAYPCRPSSIRGLRAKIVVLNELAFFRNAEGNPVDVEMLRAVRPTLATTGGKLILLSSPYGQSGALWDFHRKHYGRDDDDLGLVWQASANVMNPTLPSDYLARMEQDDPDAYRSEVLGEFRVGLSRFFDPDALTPCVDSGVRERPPVAGTRYAGFTDVAGGTGKDRHTLGIAHRTGELGILDLLRVWYPPFNPHRAIAESADILRSYGLTDVSGDKFAAGFTIETFKEEGIRYLAADKDRSQLYLELLPLINAGRARLLDQPELLRELRGLERRRGTAGRDRVDHSPGLHDDQANAAAGALVVASRPRREFRIL